MRPASATTFTFLSASPFGLAQGSHELPPGFVASWQHSTRMSSLSSGPAVLAEQFWRTLSRTGPMAAQTRRLEVRAPDGEVVHRASITCRSRRYPFMGNRDLQIGGLVTSPAYRGRGLATWAVEQLVKHATTVPDIHRVWYVCDSENVPSLRIAHHVGLTQGGRGRRRVVRGFPLLGIYELESAAAFDFTRVTENWDTPSNTEQRRMARTRYHYALRQATPTSRYLEIGSGTGLGLQVARERGLDAVVGVDITWGNLQASADRGLRRLAQADAHRLPFRSSSFDVIAVPEVLYYLHDQPGFVQEVSRILDARGTLVITIPNPRRPGFWPSPGSTSYPDAGSIRALLEPEGFDVTIHGAFPRRDGALLLGARTMARGLGLVPTSLEGRGRLKRLLYRDVKPLGSAAFEVLDEEALVPIVGDDLQAQPYTVLLVTAERPA